MERTTLADFEIFRGLPPAETAAAAALWTPRAVPAGAVVWAEEDPAGEMALVVDGALQVRIGAQDIGRVGPGELVGEAAAWSGGVRTATVAAAADSHLLVLQAQELPRLRVGQPAVFDRLLERALLAQARRIQEVDRHIARLAAGGAEAPVRAKETGLGKLWKRISGAGGVAPPAPDAALRALPRLQEAGPAALQRIARALSPRRMTAGEALFLEGDPGESVFLLAEGCVDVIRHVRGGKGEKLAELYPGALFGTGSLLLRERRGASCVAAVDGWAMEMDIAAFSALTGEAGRAWREALLGALRFQLARADVQLAKLRANADPLAYEKVRAGLLAFPGQ